MLNGHPTPNLAKWNHSWKTELARSHLLMARGRSEQQSLDQDLNFSHIQICSDPGRWLTPVSATSILWLCVNGPIASHYTGRNHFHLGITLQENLLSWRPTRDTLLDGGSLLTLLRHWFSPGNRLVRLYWPQLPYLQFSLLVNCNSRFKWGILSQTGIKGLQAWQAACVCGRLDSDSASLHICFTPLQSHWLHWNCFWSECDENHIFLCITHGLSIKTVIRQQCGLYAYVSNVRGSLFWGPFFPSSPIASISSPICFLYPPYPPASDFSLLWVLPCPLHLCFWWETIWECIFKCQCFLRNTQDRQKN